MMKRVIAGLCLWACVLAGIARSAGAAANGWVNITPQASLKGWTRVAIPPTRPLNPASQWRLDRAAHEIICKGNGGHEWLRYDHPYKDFVFDVQWKLTEMPGKRGYNSGIFVRNSKSGKVWYQAQVGSTDGGYFFGDNPLNGLLQRFNLKSQLTVNHMRLPGNWNAYRIRCVGKTLTLWVNGVKQSRFTQCNLTEGYLGLEAEGSRIEFRRLRVKVLP